MTEPRHTASTIDDDALDKLYARIAELENQAAIDTQVMEKADRECDEHIDAGRKFKAWGEEQHARAERAEAAIARARAVEEHWRHAFIASGNAGGAHALAMVRAALDEPAPLTDAAGNTICTCTFNTPCGCGTSVHYEPKEH
jgi:hypothetical protein